MRGSFSVNFNVNWIRKWEHHITHSLNISQLLRNWSWSTINNYRISKLLLLNIAQFASFMNFITFIWQGNLCSETILGRTAALFVICDYKLGHEWLQASFQSRTFSTLSSHCLSKAASHCLAFSLHHNPLFRSSFLPCTVHRHAFLFLFLLLFFVYLCFLMMIRRILLLFFYYN